ncbi:winged helix-turn-helix domain-containing protein [Brevibacillus borstelensis]|uniref:winged helix-turn-helix domain-containing protein n=1 Tax=Brevibacillus borstelensis TaxID=45462 RepID=UPI0030BED95B
MKTIKTTKRALRRFLLETQMLLDSPEAEKGSGVIPGETSLSPTSFGSKDGFKNGFNKDFHNPMDSSQILQDRVRNAIRRLECVQIDPVNAVRPNQHLVLAARIPGYRPEILDELLRAGAFFEYLANAACVIPMEDYPIFEPTRQRLRERVQPQLDQLEAIADGVRQKLGEEGPLPSKAFESNLRVRGYWDNVSAKTKATSHALNLLLDAAEISVVGREGNQRLFDLSSRIVPAELMQRGREMETGEALNALLDKYLRAYRVFEPSDPRLGWQRMSASERRSAIERCIDAGEVVQVELEDTGKPYFILASDSERLHAHIDKEQAQAGEEAPAIRFLPPLDNLLWSRKRLEDLFAFEYRWEIYTPAAKRKYGYYAMPILAGDRLIGRMDPRLDKKSRHLSVQLLQIEPQVKFTGPLKKQVLNALQTFAANHGADTLSIEQTKLK